MADASEGISLGTGVLIAVAVCSLLIIGFRVASAPIAKQYDNLAKITTGVRESNYASFDDKDVSGFDLWDEFRSMRGKRINGEDFKIVITTGLFSDTWVSSQSVGEVISDDPASTRYVNEDSMFHCTLIRSNDDHGDIIGINAVLVQ